MGAAEWYLKAEGWLHRAGTVVGAVRQGFWLGMMDTAALNRLTMLSYGRSEMYASERHNICGLFDWEAAAMEKHFGGCRRLLIGAAGAGREMIALSRRGFQIEAFECSAALVNKGREFLKARGIEASYVVAKPSEVPVALGGEFDGAILGWSAYMHIPGSETRVQMLGAMGKCLRPGAPLLASFLTRVPHRTDGLVTRIGNGVRGMRGVEEKVEAGDQLNFLFRHLFTEDEVRREFNAAGFEVAHYGDDSYGNVVGVWRGRI